MSLYSSVMLDKLCNISVPWFIHAKNKDGKNCTPYFNKGVIKINGHSECKVLHKLYKYEILW